MTAGSRREKGRKMADDMSIFTEKFMVMANEVDAGANAKPTTILDYLQNTAWRHYISFEKAGGQVLADGLGWVVSKIKIKMERMPEWEENIKVKTWSPGFEKLYAYRNFEITGREDKVIGTSTFAWLVIDINKKRPVRPSDYEKIWPFHKTELFYDMKSKVEKPENPSLSAPFKAVYSDIDVNGHVNNVKYVQWIIDRLDAGMLEDRRFQGAEINFLAESFAGEDMKTGIAEKDGAFLCNVIRQRDNKELCRAKIVYK